MNHPKAKLTRRRIMRGLTGRGENTELYIDRRRFVVAVAVHCNAKQVYRAMKKQG
ncbi:MAG TPA: hypothetical protein VN682_20395 [Terriglobales bacterium]|nr:hypothetical protein [Terriglobales bacterium]